MELELMARRQISDRILGNNRHYNDDDYFHNYRNIYRANRRSWSGGKNSREKMPRLLTPRSLQKEAEQDIANRVSNSNGWSIHFHFGATNNGWSIIK